MWQYEKIGSTPDFSGITPNEVLFDFDGPQIFTYEWRDFLFLAYASDYDAAESKTRLLIVETTTQEIDGLKRGHLAILDALSKPLIWAADWNGADEADNINLLPHGIDSVPESHRPEAGTLLWAHLESADEYELAAYFRHVIDTSRLESLLPLISVRPLPQPSSQLYAPRIDAIERQWTAQWTDASLLHAAEETEISASLFEQKFDAGMYENILDLKH